MACGPPARRLRVVDASGNTLWEFLGESGASTVQVLEEQLRNGDLLPTLIDSLNEPERKELLEEEFGLPPASSRTRAAALRKKLARIAQDKRFSLFDSRYRGQDRTSDRRVRKAHRQCLAPRPADAGCRGVTGRCQWRGAQVDRRWQRTDAPRPNWPMVVA